MYSRTIPGKLATLLVAAVLPCAASGFAQSSNGYVLGGIGWRKDITSTYTVQNAGQIPMYHVTIGSKATSQAAVGGEWVFLKSARTGGVGIGGELGFVAGHSSFGTASLSGYYHIPTTEFDGKLDPFLFAGYTAALDLGGSANMVNLGGGLHYWFLRHLGVRGEFRDFIHPAPNQSAHFWAFRGGFTFH